MKLYGTPRTGSESPMRVPRRREISPGRCPDDGSCRCPHTPAPTTPDRARCIDSGGMNPSSVHAPLLHLSRVLVASLVLSTATALPAASEPRPDQARRVGPGPGAGSSTTSGWPLRPSPQVVSGFQPPSVRWGSGHRGVDLRASPGQALLAPRDAVVGFVGTVASTAVVTLEHGDGTRSTYQPAATPLPRGAVVVEGEQFGLVLPATSHCAPTLCLHWGLRRGAEYLDPLSLVRARQVRLLPDPTG